MDGMVHEVLKVAQQIVFIGLKTTVLTEEGQNNKHVINEK